MAAIAFYAPLKAPDHPVPSGDRQMARQLMAALRLAGHEVELLSRFRSFTATPEPEQQRRLIVESAAEADAISARWQTDARLRPELLFTYHLYYKAPDLLGPVLAERFGLPYATAEASHAAKRDTGPWRSGHRRVEEALRHAAVNFCFTANDRDGLAALVDPARLVDLPPFIDAAPFGIERRPSDAAAPTLIVVAMMRHGDKLRSYRFLADALTRLQARDWQLHVVGDGPARSEVEAAFARLAARVTWRGALDPSEVPTALATADLFVWPGFNEAFGLSYLEAQAQRLPAVAVRGEGTPSVIRHEETGLLTPGDPAAYAAAMDLMIRDGAARRRFGAAAARFVRSERTLGGAASRLNSGLRPILRAPGLPRS